MVIFGHYVFSVLEFIYFMEQVIFKLILNENNITTQKISGWPIDVSLLAICY